MKLLDVASALGMDIALESILWWAILYFFIVHVVMGLLGEMVRTGIKSMARAAVRALSKKRGNQEYRKKYI